MKLGFTMSSTASLGPFLAALVASKPGGRILELGTGIGTGVAWILQGLPTDATLTTVELDPELSRVAQNEFATDSRVTFRVGDGEAALADFATSGATFDLIFADTWPGKFSARDLALGCLAPGGIYLIDDLEDPGTWPDGHADKVAELIEDLESRPALTVLQIPWASGILIAVRSR